MAKIKVKIPAGKHPYSIERFYLKELLLYFDNFFSDLFKDLKNIGLDLKLDSFDNKTKFSLFDLVDKMNLDDLTCNHTTMINYELDQKEETKLFDYYLKEIYDYKPIEIKKDSNLFAYDLFDFHRNKISNITKVFNLKLADISKNTSDYNYKIWLKQVKAGLKVDIFKAEPFLETEIEAFTAENVRLIKNINHIAVDKIQSVVTEAVKNGDTAKNIIPKVKNILSVNQTRAALIAVDQISKLNGTLTKQRQTNLGVKEYDWLTVGDERVRLSHRALNGKRFKWDSPPSEGHPSQRVRCRCQAMPVFESIEGLNIL